MLQFLIPHSENVSSFLISQQALRCRRTAAPRSRPPWRWWSPRRRGWPTPPQLRRWPRQRWRSPRWRVAARQRDHTSSNPETWTSWRPPASERRLDIEAARTLKVPVKWKRLSHHLLLLLTWVSFICVKTLWSVSILHPESHFHPIMWSEIWGWASWQVWIQV